MHDEETRHFVARALRGAVKKRRRGWRTIRGLGKHDGKPRAEKCREHKRGKPEQSPETTERGGGGEKDERERERERRGELRARPWRRCGAV
jgi:hypothetical protein